MARSDLLRDPWFSPAGFSRGQYLGITKLALNPSQGARDELYQARVNPIVTFPENKVQFFSEIKLHYHHLLHLIESMSEDFSSY